ncbi:like protein ATG12 [Seminavis robusta]|uniref:Ubiquitin-like protein ATG12 n=1 Tax=Seminavis robusta TaxID=568900 RepID=A0A9N8DM22_9STRA|nr:like protein ATG12 [Seminavis robusta]|eukprot:Sro219_g090430.1 like protein ATG12 (110) ;mRNA; f:40333-40790
MSDPSSENANTNGQGNPAAEEKVKVHFVAVGSAPMMKKTKFQIGADQRFSSVITFLRKILKLSGTGSSLFLYCNSAFAPGPDECVGDLRDCFNVRGELVINYSLQEAWG